MSNLEFRSDVSMQDVDVPKLVLFYLVPRPSTVAIRLTIQAPFLEQVLRENHAEGTQISRTAFKIKCKQDVYLDQPIPVLSNGSDPSQCDLVLDGRYADPVHCQVYAQLNSGFDVWIIEDKSANGTLYRSRKDEKRWRSIHHDEELATERLILKDCRAVQGLRYIRIGPYGFDCVPSDVDEEIAERKRWFCRHEPLPVTSQMFFTQLAGRKPNTKERKSIGEGGFGEVFKSMEMQTGLLVAVKKQKVDNDRRVENVLREIRSMKDLHHQNVVKIIHSYETVSEYGLRVFHLVMPLYSCSLRNALPMMKFESKRKAMIQMVQGLKYIHSNGFLHRDIKPENVFISERTPTNIVLGDLGLLSPVGAIGRMAGTKPYKAPEVHFDLRQSYSIDVYASGITFLEVLDSRATQGGWQGLKQWVEDLWDHPPPPPFSRLIIQMAAPHPHTLRPSLDTIQHLLTQMKDLPESVERPKLNLKKTVEMMEQKHAASAKPTPRVLMAVPAPQAAPPQPQIQHTNSRLDPRLFGLGARNIFEEPVTKRAGPLDLVHKARGLAPQENTVRPHPQPKSPDSVHAAPGSILSPVRSQSKESSTVQWIDFSKEYAELATGNIFSKKKLDLRKADLKARQRSFENRVQELERMERQCSEQIRTYRRERVIRRKANVPRREPYPGDWPSRPMYSGAGGFSRTSRSTNDASQDPLYALTSSDPHLDDTSRRSTTDSSLRKGNARSHRPTRTRVITHGRHNAERTSKRASERLHTKMLQGLTRALRAGAGEVCGRLARSIRWTLGL